MLIRGGKEGTGREHLEVAGRKLTYGQRQLKMLFPRLKLVLRRAL